MVALRSAVYRGRVSHTRYAPKPHAFDYSLFLLYLDLDELPKLFEDSWLWSHERANIASYRREHYFGDPGVPLKQALRQRVREFTGIEPPNGPIGLLTNLSYFGLSFNPVSFYYLFEEDGETLHAIVAEITNTPWKERFQYVLPAKASGGADGHGEWTFRKAFHVSPFFGMDHEYDWAFTTPAHAPGTDLTVSMENRLIAEQGERVFHAGLTLKRQEWSPRALRRCLLNHPWMSGKVVAGIYWQALRLWMKKVPFFSHPSHG